MLVNFLWEPQELTENREERKCVFLCGGLMNPLSRHDHQRLGLNHDRVIADVQLDVRNETLTLSLEFVSDRVVCPECGAACPMQDHAVTRTWRYLGAMPFDMILTSRISSLHMCDMRNENNSRSMGRQAHRFTLLSVAFAGSLFHSWWAWGIRRRLGPIRKVACVLKNRLDRILAWFSSPISNGPAEGFSSRIQNIKSAAQVYLVFKHCWIRPVLGKLSLKICHD